MFLMAPAGTRERKKMIRAGRAQCPGLRLYYKAIGTKTARHWPKNQTRGSMEENGEPRNHRENRRTITLRQRRRVYSGVKTAYPISDLGKTGQPRAKGNWTPADTTDKN